MRALDDPAAEPPAHVEGQIGAVAGVDPVGHAIRTAPRTGRARTGGRWCAARGARREPASGHDYPYRPPATRRTHRSPADINVDVAVSMTEDRLLEAARKGDEAAFGGLLEPHQRELHAHCYRMLGSVHDADDALQDADAARVARRSTASRAAARCARWLYTIATNTCLTHIERRPKRVLPVDYGPATDPHRARASRSSRRSGSSRTRTPTSRTACRPGGALRAARERRARLHRRAPAPARHPARRPDPARGARLHRQGGRRGARDHRRRASTARCSARAPRSRSASPSRASRQTLQPLGDERARARSSRRYVDAWERNDVDAVVALLTEDARSRCRRWRAGSARATSSRTS